jgi:hypothetical protein
LRWAGFRGCLASGAGPVNLKNDLKILFTHDPAINLDQKVMIWDNLVSRGSVNFCP